MANKSKNGKIGIFFNVTKGTLVEGDAATALSDNSWYQIVAVATSSELPFSADPLGRIFKTGATAAAITPAVGDNVYPLTFTKIAKTDLSISQETGTIDNTDDDSSGFSSSISDGFTAISGSCGRMMKFDETTGELSDADQDFLSRFWDLQTDDGAGVYTLTAKNDDDVLLAYLRNSGNTSAADIQEWQIFPAILSGISGDGALKGVQNGNLTFTKGEGPATRYQRTTNATETVF